MWLPLSVITKILSIFTLFQDVSWFKLLCPLCCNSLKFWTIKRYWIISMVPKMTYLVPKRTKLEPKRKNFVPKHTNSFYFLNRFLHSFYIGCQKRQKRIMEKCRKRVPKLVETLVFDGGRILWQEPDEFFPSFQTVRTLNPALLVA